MILYSFKKHGLQNKILTFCPLSAIITIPLVTLLLMSAMSLGKVDLMVELQHYGRKSSLKKELLVILVQSQD